METEKILKTIVDSTNNCFSRVAYDMENVEKGLDKACKCISKLQRKQAKQGLILFNLTVLSITGGLYFVKKVQDLNKKIEDLQEEIVTNLDEIVTNPCGMCVNSGLNDDMK